MERVADFSLSSSFCGCEWGGECWEISLKKRGIVFSSEYKSDLHVEKKITNKILLREK